MGTVNFDLQNRRIIEEARRDAADDEAIMVGLLRCRSCSAQHMALTSFPDWALGPIACECETCGEKTSLYLNDEHLVRIHSRRQYASG